MSTSIFHFPPAVVTVCQVRGKGVLSSVAFSKEIGNIRRMGEKNFIDYLNDHEWIHVVFKTAKGQVVEFVVKYMAIIAGMTYEIVRFDSGHEYNHVDVLRPDGTKYRQMRLPYMTKNEVLSFAINDIRINSDIYKSRFKQWL